MADPARNIDRRRKLIKGKPLNPSAPAILRYQHALESLVRHMTATYERAIAKFLAAPVAQEYFALDMSVAAQAKILMTELAKKFEDLFGAKSKILARDMTKDAAASSNWALKGSLKGLTGGLTLKTDILTGELKDVLKASIAENVSLIKSIAETYHKQVEGALYRSITSAQGGAQIVPFLKRYRGVTERRARLIADDQHRKVFQAINRSRLQKLGLRRFEWIHTMGSQHPRKLHQRMSGNLYFFDKPPIIDERTGERGFPGQLPNCRCRINPVIDFSDRD